MDNNINIIINSPNLSSQLKTYLFSLIVNDKIKIYSHIPFDNNSIYYFLKKKQDGKIINKLKNNYLVYEPLDVDWKSFANFEAYYKHNINYFNLFDEIICNSKFMAENFKSLGYEKKLSVSYHEYDIKYNASSDKSTDILYCGFLKKSSFSINDFKKYNIKLVKDYNTINKNVCIHIDYLINNKLYYTLHTATKLSTAMYFNCIFICNRIPVYVELLGEEYELYLNDDLSNIDEIIKKAKNILDDNKLYNDYIKQYAHVRERLSPINVANNYKNIFNI